MEISGRDSWPNEGQHAAMGGAEARVRQEKPQAQDWITMPLLSLLTMFLIVVPAEWISRLAFPRSKTTTLDCTVVDDPKTGVRGIPNCVAWEKQYEESGAIEYRLNSRGHRAGVELGPKEPGTYRIVMVGSSIAEGLRVPREQSLAALLPKELSRETGRKVSLYNEGMIYGTPRRVDLAFKEALDAEPDMIFWPVTPWDMEHAALADAPWAKLAAGAQNATAEARDPDRAQWQPDGTPGETIFGRLRNDWQLAVDTLDRARMIIVLRHYLYKSQTQYVRSFLMQGEGGQFMRAKLSPSTKSRLGEFDRYAGDFMTRARRAGVPVVVTVVPHGAEATMISMGKWPTGSDPFALGDEVRSIVERHGGIYVDILHRFQSIPNPERYFLAVDGHPTAEGYRVLTTLLDKGLTGGAVPALRACGESGVRRFESSSERAK